MVQNYFSKKTLPRKIPEELQLDISKLKKSKSKMDCLDKAYGIVTSRYEGHKMDTYLRFGEFLNSDIANISKKRGFLHCTHQNYLLRFLLVKSGFFKDKDVKQKNLLLYGVSPHQYLEVDVGSKKKQKWVKVDPWGSAYGVPLGKRASIKTLFKVRKRSR